MDLEELFHRSEQQVLDEAYDALDRFNQKHYKAAGEAFTRQRLTDLFHLVTEACRTRDLTTISAYAETVATERFNQGFDISEVQTAFNALEEAMWRRLLADASGEELVEGVGVLSTVLGFGKDALARTFVSLAAKRRVPSLDLTALFAGPES